MLFQSRGLGKNLNDQSLEARGRILPMCGGTLLWKGTELKQWSWDGSELNQWEVVWKTGLNGGRAGDRRWEEGTLTE